MTAGSNEHVIGLPYYFSGDPVSLELIEGLIGVDSLDVINSNLKEGETAVLGGSAVQVGIEVGGYVVDNEGSVPLDRSSDTDLYVTSGIYERLLANIQGEVTSKKFSTEVVINGRRLDIINVDEMQKNWREGIESLLVALGEPDPNIEPAISIPTYTEEYSLETREAVRLYMREKLQHIIKSLDQDPSPVNFLRFNGLTSSEALSVSLIKKSGELNAYVNDPTDTLRDAIKGTSKSRQYKEEKYIGIVNHEINYDSLSGVLLYASLLEGHFEVPDGLMPYKLGTTISRLVRVVSERRTHLAGMYQLGECTPEDLWYNALFRTGQRIVNNDYPIVCTDEETQLALKESVRYQMQDEFARAMAQDPAIAAVQMFMSTPLSGMISPVLAEAFEKYHDLVLPNSIGHAEFVWNRKYVNKGGVKVAIDDPKLGQVRDFVKNTLQVMHTFYPRKFVGVWQPGRDQVGGGLSYERWDGPKSMSEAMAIVIYSMRIMLPEGRNFSDVSSIEEERVARVCKDWVVKGSKPSSFTTTIQPEFDMSVNEEDVKAHIEELERKRIAFMQAAAENPRP